MRVRACAAAFVVVSLAGGGAVSRAGTIDPAVMARLDRPAQAAQRPIPVIIELESRPDLAALLAKLSARPLAERPGALAATLQAAFERSAPKVRAALGRAGAMQVEPLWIAHGFAAQLPPGAVRQLAAEAGVARIYLDMQLKAPVRAQANSMRATLKREAPDTVRRVRATVPAMADPAGWRGEVPSHLSALGASAYWQRGVTGKGVVVAVVDSGVDAREAPLMAKFRGGSRDWFDPYGQRALPFDACRVPASRAPRIPVCQGAGSAAGAPMKPSMRSSVYAWKGLLRWRVSTQSGIASTPFSPCTETRPSCTWFASAGASKP